MTRTGSELPVLVAQAGLLNGKRWLVDGTLTIGRDPSCDVVIMDRQVSRFHAQLSADRDGVRLEDLGSKNGIRCNHEVVLDSHTLQDGDLIQVAMIQEFVFLSSDSTLPLDENLNPLIESGGRLLLDSRSRRVWIHQTELLPPLSVPQFRLLQVLYEQQGNVVSRQDMVNAIWGSQESQGVSEQALDALIRRLRDRLAQLDPEPSYLMTVRGYGLRLENPKN